MKSCPVSRKFLIMLALSLFAALMTGCEVKSPFRHDLTLYQNGKLLGQWKNVTIERNRARTENGKALQILPADGIELKDGCFFRAGGVVILTRSTTGANNNGR